MNVNENWVLWNPSNVDLGPAFSVEVVQGENEIKFILDCESRCIEIIFHGLVPVYTYSVDGIRIATWEAVQESNKDRYYFQKWFLYKVENSGFLDWALRESCGYYSKEDLTHYCIVTEQNMVDILAMSEPQINTKMFK